MSTVNRISNTEHALEPFLVVPGDRDARKTQVLADLSENPIKTEISNLDVVCMYASIR